MRDFDIQVGIKKPGKEPTSVAEMFEAILRNRYDSLVINKVMQAAEIGGRGPEQTMVMLAYTALRSLQDTSEQLSHVLSVIPNPVPILKPSTG